MRRNARSASRWFAGDQVHRTEPVPRARCAGVDLGRPAKRRLGLIEHAQFAERLAQTDRRVEVVGRDLQHHRVLRGRLLRVAGQAQQPRQVRPRDVVARVQFEAAAVTFHGVFVAPLVLEHDGEVEQQRGGLGGLRRVGAGVASDV